MLNRVFLIASAERGIKTFAQALLAALTLSSPSIDVLHINWVGDLSLAAGATLLSFLTSFAGLVPATSPAPAAADEQTDPAAPAPAAGGQDALRQWMLSGLAALDSTDTVAPQPPAATPVQAPVIPQPAATPETQVNA